MMLKKACKRSRRLKNCNLLFVLFVSVLSVACSVSLNITDTHGTATDVVDSTPTTDTKTDADVKIPLPGALST